MIDMMKSRLLCHQLLCDVRDSSEFNEMNIEIVGYGVAKPNWHQLPCTTCLARYVCMYVCV